MTNSLVTYVALLRGINVGGNTLISMATLKVRFEELGYVDVRTYINSGNVIFRTASHDPRDIELTIEQCISKHFSLEVRTVVISLETMNQIMRHIPASWQDTDQKCNVIFLRHTIDTPNIMSNFAPKPDIEEIHYYPGVLFWSAQTSSLTKSTMLKLSGSPLYKHMTVRILNTVRKIHTLMQEADSLPTAIRL